MQIARSQNHPNQKPNFSARTLLPHKSTLAKHLNEADMAIFDEQVKIVEKQGDDLSTLHVVVYEPKQKMPFAILSEMKNVYGKRVIKWSKDLALFQLGIAAHINHDNAQKELKI
jgi:hypothetical protein